VSGVDVRFEHPYRGVVTAIQPAGREPAPAPLDVVQDFVNTEIPEWAQDDIASPAALGAWLEGRGLLEPGTPVAAEAFLRARALRSCLRDLALANTTGQRLPIETGPGRTDELDGLRFGFAIGPDGEPRLVPVGDGADRALAAIVSIAAAAARDGSWRRLKACRKEGCGWVFYDHSRNRSSNWCSMTICGNRTKTAGYRRRKAAR
jgi:predicted RNA-binding Zn ribbon-like protein